MVEDCNDVGDSGMDRCFYGIILYRKTCVICFCVRKIAIFTSTELIANHLYAPSYVSMSSALRYYGLIPETVYTKQSMTLKHSRDFDTPLGRFEYTNISREAFPVGLTSMKKEDYAFVMATPEKALCDLIANSPKVNLRYLKDAEIYLEEDIRMELEEFKQMNAEIFEEYMKVGKKAESIRTLLKLMRK